MLYPEMYLLAAKTAEGTLPLLKEFPLPGLAPDTTFLLSLFWREGMLYPEMYLLAAKTAEGTLPLLKEFPLPISCSDPTYNIPSLSSGEKECCSKGRYFICWRPRPQGNSSVTEGVPSARSCSGYNIPTLSLLERRECCIPEDICWRPRPQRELFRY